MRTSMILIAILFAANLSFAESPATHQDKHPISANSKATNKGYRTNPFIDNTSAHNHTAITNKEDDRWYDKLDKNRFLFSIGLLQLIVFGWQGWLLRKTIKGNQIIERPYIFAEPVGYSMEIVDNVAVWKCNYIIKNHGKTPAIITNKNIFLWLVSDGEYPTFDLVKNKDIPDGGFVFKSGDERPFKSAPKNMDNIADAKWIESGQGINKLFCVGRVDYKDIFGKKHFTEFEWVFISSEVIPKGFYLTANEKRNRYT